MKKCEGDFSGKKVEQTVRRMMKDGLLHKEKGDADVNHASDRKSEEEGDGGREMATEADRE